jgi:predicted Zn-dependent peptidase
MKLMATNVGRGILALVIGCGLGACDKKGGGVDAVAADAQAKVEGDAQARVEGDAQAKVEGDAQAKVEGDAHAVAADAQAVAADAQAKGDAQAVAGDAGAADPEAFRATRPTPSEIKGVEAPKVERFTLSNGLEGYFIPQSTLPTFSMTIELDVGAIDDPADKIGLASVCLDLFSESTARLDKVAWSEALADHAVQIFSPAALETSSIAVRALVSEMGPALDLLSELLTSPGMRKDDFARIIADRKAALAQSRGTANGIAGRLFPGLVWGMEHPYGRVQTDKHLDKIKLADCKAWIGQVKPKGARVWVTGKIGKDELVAELEKRLASWTGDAPKAREIPPAPAPKGAIYAVQVDGAVQSMVLVGFPGPRRDAADYEANFLMAQIYGGSFSSRINMNLREAKGYAYGSSGRFSYRRAGSHFATAASVETTTTALSLTEIAAEVKKMRTTEPTADELVRERDGALLALPARFATPGDALDELRSLVFFGLPSDWFDGYKQRLEAVDAKAVKAAAEAHLVGDGADVVVLVVGDLKAPAKGVEGKTLADEIQRLADEKVFGQGGVVRLDPDGKVLK